MVSDNKNDIEGQIVQFVYDDPGDLSLSFIGWLDQIKSISMGLADDHAMKTITEAIPNAQSSPLFVASAFDFDCLLRTTSLGSESVNWDQRNERGHTSLYLACSFGSLSVVRTLLALGADPNIQSGRHGNCLQAACLTGDESIVQMLLQHGASVQAASSRINALEACFRGHREAIALVLLKHKNTIRNAEDFEFAIHGACHAGFLQVLEWLDKSPESSRFGSGSMEKTRSKVARAIQGGQVGTLSAFLKNKSNLDDVLPDGSIAMAALYGHEKIVELLVGMGVDYESECKFGSPLRCAALMDRERIMRVLIDLGANVNKCGEHGTALEAASMKGHLRIVNLLLRSGVNVNQEGGEYGTALQAAAYHGHRNVAEALLSAGASVRVLGYRGIATDALHAAAEGGHYDIIKMMLDRGLTFFRVSPYMTGRSNVGRGPPPAYKSLLKHYSPDGKGTVSHDCEPDQ